jgi:RNA polymerase-binding protein DksA
MNIEDARRSLEAERARLQQVRDAADRLSSTGDASGEIVDVGPNASEQANETIERELDLNVLQRTETQLREIDDAIRRLDSGTYGKCEVCGKQIGEARLEAKPATRFCVEDQVKAERDPRLRSA